MGPPGGKVTEHLQIRAPWKVNYHPFSPIDPLLLSSPSLVAMADCFLLLQVDFYNLDSGAFINNTVSQGKDEKDLYLTFYFEWPYPHIQEGSDEVNKLSDQLWAGAKEVVQHTIDVARDMAKEGKLGKGIEH